MNKDLRRKQKKAKRTIRAAKRRVNVATRAKAPQFESDLPMTQAAIEDEIERLLPEAALETPEVIEVGEHERKISLTPTMLRIMRLQKQLFRVVFRREPGPHDPVFWDRDREAQGFFPIDEQKGSQDLSKALAKTDIRPEIAYAIALTGMIPLEHNMHLYDEEALAAWQDAIIDYVHQEETGVLPLTPEEFMQAWEIANAVAERPNVVPIGIAGSPNTGLNRILVTLEDELGTHEKAAAAISRMAALVEIAEHEEFKHLVIPGGYSEIAVVVAASANIDRQTGNFEPGNFRARLDAISSEL